MASPFIDFSVRTKFYTDKTSTHLSDDWFYSFLGVLTKYAEKKLHFQEGKLLEDKQQKIYSDTGIWTNNILLN